MASSLLCILPEHDRPVQGSRPCTACAAALSKQRDHLAAGRACERKFLRTNKNITSIRPLDLDGIWNGMECAALLSVVSPGPSACMLHQLCISQITLPLDVPWLTCGPGPMCQQSATTTYVRRSVSPARRTILLLRSECT